jgi:tRNA A-37 threonylcarbamoyl transferase component Bud32
MRKQYKQYGDPEDQANDYLHIVLKIVKFVGEMHKRNWILRDLCAENIYVTHDNEVSSGVGTANPSRAPAVTPGFQLSSCSSIFSFLCCAL